MRKFIKILIVLGVVLLGCYFYFDYKKDSNAPKFITTTLKTGDLESSVIATGEVYAQDLVDVGAQVGGQIKKLYVKLGDRVKEGDLIAQIDSVRQENDIAKQKAGLAIYEANLASAKIVAQNADIKYKREQNLYSKNATSKESVESAKNDAALQKANVEVIKAQIEQTKIELDTAMTNLGYTKITAPLDGVIVSVPVEEGKTLNANQTTPTIVKIADLSKMEIRLEITEGDISKIKEGMEVKYNILSDIDNIKSGVISSIDPAIKSLSDGNYDKSATSSASANEAVYFYAKVLVDNGDNFLKIGMTTENSIIISSVKDAKFIPTSAIKRDKGGNFVLVQNGLKEEKKYIKIGVSDNFNTQILSGLDDKDKVILSGANGSKSSHQPPMGMRM